MKNPSPNQSDLKHYFNGALSIRIRSVLINAKTQIQSGFMVSETPNIHETIAFLVEMHKQIENMFKEDPTFV